METHQGLEKATTRQTNQTQCENKTTIHPRPTKHTQ